MGRNSVCESKIFQEKVAVGYKTAWLLWGEFSATDSPPEAARGAESAIVQGAVLVHSAVDRGLIQFDVSVGAEPQDWLAKEWTSELKGRQTVDGSLLIMSLDMSSEEPYENLGEIPPGPYDITLRQWHDESHIDAIGDKSGTERAWIHLAPCDQEQ